jgi:hypothetical protein
VKDCGKASYPGPDVGVVAGLFWPKGKWPLGTTTQAYICIDNYAGSTVRLEPSSEQLTIRPARLTVPDGGGVLPVSVTATATGRTEVTVLVVNPSGKQQLSRIVAAVVADQAHWHFEKDG